MSLLAECLAPRRGRGRGWRADSARLEVKLGEAMNKAARPWALAVGPSLDCEHSVSFCICMYVRAQRTIHSSTSADGERKEMQLHARSTL